MIGVVLDDHRPGEPVMEATPTVVDEDDQIAAEERKRGERESRDPTLAAAAINSITGANLSQPRPRSSPGVWPEACA